MIIESVDISLTEAANAKAFKFVTSETEIKSEVSENELQKITSVINKNWRKIKKNIDEYINTLIPQWYKNDDKYEYGINSANKALKFAVLDTIVINKYSNYYIVEIWYNNYKNKESDKFFKNHSILCTVKISNDFSVDEIETGLEG